MNCLCQCSAWLRVFEKSTKVESNIVCYWLIDFDMEIRCYIDGSLGKICNKWRLDYSPKKCCVMKTVRLWI